MDKLKQHRWPGNVRELENLMRRLAALCPHEMIGDELIAMELADAAPLRRRLAAPAGAGDPGAKQWSATSASSSPRTMTAWARQTSMTG